MSGVSLRPLTPLRIACKRARCRSIQPATCRAWSSTPPHLKQEPPVSESTQDLLNKLKRDSRIRDGASSLGRGGVGSVGPFPMGVGMGSATSKTWKSWRELNLRGKGERMPLPGAPSKGRSPVALQLFVSLLRPATSVCVPSSSRVLTKLIAAMLIGHRRWRDAIHRAILRPHVRALLFRQSDSTSKSRDQHDFIPSGHPPPPFAAVQL